MPDSTPTPGIALALSGGGFRATLFHLGSLWRLNEMGWLPKLMWPGGVRTEIRVVNGPTGKYLRTDRDNTSRNNLDDLPDCY